MVDLSIDKIKYGGQYHYFFWDPAFNPLATLENCLGNCTCFVIGDCGVTGTPRPVSRVVGAQDWDKYLTNEWRCIDYNPSQVKVGDIIQWVAHRHVARVFKVVNGVPWVRGSYYTGEHGVSTLSDGSFDTRSSFNSMQDFSNFMVQNYPSRFYHEYPLDEESKRVGGNPEHILVMPNTITPVERDENVDQIRTTDVTLRIRTSPSLSGSIVGFVQLGYYNVLATQKATSEDTKAYKEAKGDDLTEWYEISKDRWCGNVTTEFLPKKSESDITKAMEIITKAVADLQNENARYKEGMQQIADIVNKFM